MVMKLNIKTIKSPKATNNNEKRVRKVSEVISAGDKNRCNMRNVVRREVKYRGSLKSPTTAYTSDYYRLSFPQ